VDSTAALFYFGSWERNSERHGFFSQYTVPTAKMRTGDFSEVLAFNPAFRIYDPSTGTSDGRNRKVFDGAIIPADRISSIALKIQCRPDLDAQPHAPIRRERPRERHAAEHAGAGLRHQLWSRSLGLLTFDFSRPSTPYARMQESRVMAARRTRSNQIRMLAKQPLER
jgi:hypothetical protein